jgi:integrase
MGVLKMVEGGIAVAQPNPPRKPEPAWSGRGARGTDRLTDAQIRNAKPHKGKQYKLSDGRGMYLLVKENGSKLWRMKYDYDGGEKLYAIGVYPEIGLAEARESRKQARDWLREGKDPTKQRRIAKASVVSEQATTFKAVAEEYLSKQDFTARHIGTLRMVLQRDVYPDLGDLPIGEGIITPTMGLAALKKIEARGTLEMCAKTRRLCSQIARYAVQSGRRQTDPFALLTGALKAPKTVNRATVQAKEMPSLFKALNKVPAEANTKLAMYWLMLTACRTGEMRFALWGEIEGGKLWRIPAARMKMDREHVVPLSTQAQAILRKAKELRTSDAEDALIFPGFTRHGALSENALLALLARAGFFGRQTAHGFRASFSTWAHEEAEALPDVIESCLAHSSGDVRAVYNRAAYISRRRELLQQWGDQLEKWGMRVINV